MQTPELHLKKVTLNLTNKGGDDSPLEFIYGVGREGLSSFEAGLAGMGLGEEKDFEISGSGCEPFFGHLYGRLSMALGLLLTPPTLSVKVRLERVEEASPTEIVKAMSSSLKGCGCGDGCSC